MKLRKAARVILIGAPGVGKGTQSARMLERYKELSSISSGDLLRDNVRNRTPLGIQAEHLMKTGALVPDSMILRLIQNTLLTRGWLTQPGGPKPLTLNFASPYGIQDTLIEHDNFFSNRLPPRKIADEFEYSDSPSASFILDGFPRTASQADKLDELIPINLVVNISTPTEIILDRICNRYIHQPSGRTYNLTFNKPKVEGKDDITGEPLTQREDDKPEVWKERLHRFEESSRSLLEHYDKMGILWTVTGNSSDEISPRLFKEFEKRFGRAGT
ncbi:hypothetical protein B0A48_14305 [Cryoendolithus antarcticus]|uniref:GTP:AMP phosphotransferase, mitochondrial n=1 Tax=Cryoendolithus antarcticus TaxID=1507870 RepID=A0A1V8SJL3_9PEZI|nr:hypothetical protein B0A48_14305 [Cryoendolithus antarcticus]